MSHQTLQRCCKMELGRLQSQYYDPEHGLNTVALTDAVLTAVKEHHAEILRQSQDQLLRAMIQTLLREMHHGSRSHLPPLAQAEGPTHTLLPGFKEIAEEYYTDSENRRWCLLDMSLDRLRNAINYYRGQELAYRERAARLQRFAAAMEARGLGAQATVRDLYTA